MTNSDLGIVWIDAANGVPAEKLGGKLRSLVELLEDGFPVPYAFGLSTDSFEIFLRSAGLSEKVHGLMKDVEGADLATVQRISKEVTSQVLAAELPAELREAIADAYHRLEERSGREGVPVAVRSSGVNEDLEGASFAGQYETYLWVCGVDAVLEHVRRCWAGIFSPEVLTYRPQGAASLDLTTVAGMSVVVQQMVESVASGVAFTVDPLNGDRSKVIIESCWGLGEGVVKGDVSPDRFKYDKVTLEQLESSISAQESEYRFDTGLGRVDLLPLNGGHGGQASLTGDQAKAVVELAKSVERKRGGAPQDLEWALDSSGELCLLQARPETVWAAKADAAASAGPKTALERIMGTMTGMKQGS